MSTIATLSVELIADLTPLQTALSRVGPMLAQAGEQASQASSRLSNVGDGATASVGRFSASLTALQVKLLELQGQTAEALRMQFPGVPDTKLAEYQAAKTEIAQIAANQRIVAEAVREIEQAENRAAIAAERMVKASQDEAIAQKAAAEAAAKKSVAANEQAFKSAGKTAGEVAGGAVKIAEGFTLAGVATAVFASKFDQQMMTVKHNTTMSNEEFVKMRAGVLAMGQESGLPFDKIANAMMRTVNEGFTMDEALKINRSSMMASRAANSDMEVTTRLLATTLHEFNLKAGDSSRVMATLHVAANAGGATLEDFTNRAGPAISAAAAMKVPLADVAAAYSALTRNGFTAAQANTLIRGVLAQILHPSKQAKDNIIDLSNASGVDLVHSMTAAGLQTKGFTGIMGDLFKATDGNASIIVEKLMPAQRGGFAGAVLAGKGIKDLGEIYKQTTATFDEKFDPIPAQFAESMQQATAKVEQMTNRIEAKLLPVGERMTDLFLRLSPYIEKAADELIKLMDAFSKAPPWVQNAVVGTAAVGAAGQVTGLSGFAGNIIGGGLAGRLLARGAGTAAAGAGTAAAEAAGGYGALAGAEGIVMPAAVAGGAGLTLTGVAAVVAPIAIAAAAAYFVGQNWLGHVQEQQTATERAASGANLFPIMSRIDKLQEALRSETGAAADRDRGRLGQAWDIARRQAGLPTLEQQAAARPVTQSPAEQRLRAQMETEKKHGGKTAEQIEAEMNAAAKRREEAEKAKRAALAETQRFTHLLSEEQARLNTLHEGGSKAAAQYAASLSGLTGQHKAQMTAVHAQVVAAEEAEKARAKQQETEKRFGTLVSETQNRINAANGSEVSGLEKMKAAYAGISESRIEAELAHEADAKAAEKEHDTLEKLQTRLDNVKSEIADGTDKTGIHRVAVEATGVSYDKLSTAAQGLVTQIAAVNRQTADTKAAEAVQKKLTDAQDKIKLLYLPPLEREFTQYAGGTKVLDQMTASMRAQSQAAFILEKAHAVASSAFAEGVPRIGLYAAAMQALTRTVSENRRELASAREQQTDHAMRLAALDVGNEDRVNSGAVDEESIYEAQQLRRQILQSQRGGNRQQAADLYREFQSLGPDVAAQVGDIGQANKAQSEIQKSEFEIGKLSNKLHESQAEANSFKQAMLSVAAQNGRIAGSFDPVIAAIERMKAAMQGAGKNVTEGFAAGLKTNTPQSDQSAQDMAQSAIDTVSDMLGIQSPSRVFAQIGQYTVDGLAVGLKNGTRTVADAASGLVQMTVSQAMSAIPITQSWKEIAAQQSVSSFFAEQVVHAAQQKNMDLGLSLGATNPGGYGDILAEGQLAELRREAMNYSSLNVGGQTMTRQDSANQLSGGSGGHTFNIHMNINTPDVAGFNNSRGQVMQQMYEEAASFVRRNG